MEKMPKILSPIKSFKGAVGVIRAGADELYCGVRIPGKIQDLVFYRNVFCEVPSYDELKKITQLAHRPQHQVKVFLTANQPFMTTELEEEMRKHILSCVEAGIDGLLVGDLGMLAMIKEMNLNLPLYASTFFASTNSNAVEFLRKLGFSRVVLDRHMTIPEIRRITSSSKVDIEVFVHGGGCSNINGNCYLFHNYTLFYRSPKQIPPCQLPYDVYELDGTRKKAENLPVVDGLTWCSLCKLSTLVQSGVAGLKIVDRCLDELYQEVCTKIYRNMLSMIAKGYETRSEFRNLTKEELAVMRMVSRDFDACKQKRCYYSSLFNAPYKIQC